MGEDKHRRKNRVTGSIQKCLILLCATVFCACFQCACDKEEIQVEEKKWYVYDGTRLNRVYADQFSEKIQKIAVKMIECVENAEIEIDFSEFEVTEYNINTALEIAKMSNPLCNMITITHKEKNVYAVDYGCTVEEQKKRVEELKTKVTNVITNNIASESTEEQKIRGIYSYLTSSMFYDIEIYNKYPEEVGLYQGLIEENGVCLHFAYNLQYYLTQLGIDSFICGDDGATNPDKVIQSQGEGVWHSWNIVKLDGFWYHFDATYENTVYSSSASADSNTIIQYQFYGMSDDTRKQTRDSFNRFVLGPTNITSPFLLPNCEKDLSGSK